MGNKYRYLIIGAGVAGHEAAKAVRQRDSENPVAIFGAEPYRPYNRPPLTKGFLLGQMQMENVFVEREEFYTGNGIDLVTGTEVKKLEPAARRVTTATGENIEYEKLLLATGGRARRLGLPGSSLPGVYYMRTIDDCLAIRNAAESAGRAVIIGGGFIGAEMASWLAKRGVPSAVVFPEQYLMERVVPSDLASLLHRRCEESNIEIVNGDKPVSFDGDSTLRGITTDSGRTFGADLAIVGIGIKLNTELAADAGLETTRDGGVATDQFLRTPAENIWAAGDICSYIDSASDERVRVEHWDTAKRQGAVAGAGMAGEKTAFADLPFFFSNMFDMFIQVLGHFSPADTIRRGSPESGSVAYFSFADGIFSGYLSLGRPPEEMEACKKLITGRKKKEEVAGDLADEASDLEQL